MPISAETGCAQERQRVGEPAQLKERENASMTTGQVDEGLRPAHVEPVLGLDPRMMSATQIWSRPVGTSARVRLGAIGRECWLVVVGGTNGRRRKLKRLPARMSLRTRFALTTGPPASSLCYLARAETAMSRRAP